MIHSTNPKEGAEENRPGRASSTKGRLGGGGEREEVAVAGRRCTAVYIAID